MEPMLVFFGMLALPVLIAALALVCCDGNDYAGRQRRKLRVR